MQKWEYCVIGPIWNPGANLSFLRSDYRGGTGKSSPGTAAFMDSEKILYISPRGDEMSIMKAMAELAAAQGAP